ncbi:MAG: hypothetical protein NZL98_04440, partial [Anaerolineales bacterium]|nr:hypothetical protein [Anaerolineales bacterium]
MKTHTLALYEKQKKQFIAIITLSAGLLFLLSTVVNLAMWRISGQPNFLWNSIGLGACAVLVGLSYGMERAERVNTAALLLTLSWGGYFLVHSLFWANVTSPLLVGLWILPTLLLVSRYPLPKIAILLLTLAVSIILIWLNQTPFFPRLATTDISLLRFVVPSYIAIFGLFVLPISLFGFHQRKLFVQLLFPILVMVATPIVILAINTHYNTMMSETQATQRLLDQILKSKNDQIQSWLLQQKNTLENLLQEPQSYARLLNLLTGSEKGTQEWEENFIGSIILLQRASETSDFEEIYLFNKKGIVLASSETGLIGENFEYQEFFWQGEIQPSIIPPRYYAPANQVSLFISLPIYDSLNNLVGVLSGRATIRPLLAIFYQPPPAGYQSLRFYWLGADSNVILSMQGKPNLRLETEASRNLLVNQAEGTGIYKNAAGTVVIGAYLWN